MKKKLIIYGSICIFILGFSLLLFFNKQAAENGEETAPMRDVAVIETEIETRTEPTKDSDIPERSENDTATEQMKTDTNVDDTDYVLYLKDVDIGDNPVFVAFIDKEITAHDTDTGENKYIYEYFADYDAIYGIHYMVEDLNQDAKKELLVLIQDDHGFGDLFVFEETESRELIAWKKWWNIMEDRWPYVYYCGNGIFMTVGEVDGISVKRYTQEGILEPLLFYRSTLTESNDTYYELSIWWVMYENGEETKDMEYKCYHDLETHEHIQELETKEAREGERLVDEFLEEVGEGKKITIDNIKIGSLKELQNP